MNASELKYHVERMSTFKMLEVETLPEGTLILALGVHVLRWRPEWGEAKYAFVEDEETDALITKLKEVLENAANELSNAQGEWSSVSEAYAPEWTHSLKAVECACRDAIGES